MKYSNTAITQLTRWYKQILVKCAILNAAILMGSAFVAAPAMATNLEVAPGSFVVGSDPVTGTGSVNVTGLAISDVTGLESALAAKVEAGDNISALNNDANYQTSAQVSTAIGDAIDALNLGSMALADASNYSTTGQMNTAISNAITTAAANYDAAGSAAAAQTAAEAYADGLATNYDAAGSATAAETAAKGYADTVAGTAETNAKAYADGLAANYATAAQGATADATAATIATYGDVVTHDAADFATAAQGAKADQAATDITAINGTLATYGDVVTHDAADFATAAQGATADATAATIATYGDVVTHDAADFATAAQGAKADQAATDITAINGTLATYGDVVTHDAADFATAAQGATADATAATIATYGDVVTHDAADFATAAQGATADATAATIATYGDVVTHDAADFATAAQGATADATAATIATYGDVVTHDAADFATAAQGAKADQAATDIATINGQIGTTSIASIGDGTITGAISTLNTSKVTRTQTSGDYQTTFASDNAATFVGLSGLNTDTGDESVIQVFSGKGGNEGVLIEARDGGLPTSTIRVQEAGAFYTKNGAAATANDEIVTLATATDGVYDGTTSGLAATTLGGAIDEVAGDISDVATDLGNVTAFTGSTTGNISNSVPGSGTNATNASSAIANIDATIGQIHGLAATITDAQGAQNLEQGSTVSGHLLALAGAIGDRTDYTGTNYLTNNQDIATSLVTLDGALGDVEDIVGPAQTTASGIGQFATRKIGDDINLVDAIDEIGQNMVSLDQDNVFTGLNTFKNDGGIAIQDSAGANSTRIKATADGLNVDRNVEATGFKISGQAPVVTSIDTDGTTVTSAATAANVMATSATVYYGAENGAYTGAKVKGDTATSHTINTAIAATNGALNNILTTAGDEVDSSKVDVQWNSTDTTLDTVLGNGVYASTNNIAAGDSVTLALGELDAVVGDVANVTNANGNLTGADVASMLDSIDTNMGDLSTLTTTTAAGTASLVGAVNEVVSDITVAAGTYNVLTAGADVAGNLVALDSAFTSGTLDVAFHSVKIDNAYAITGATTGELDMGGNTLTNVAGMQFDNGTQQAGLTVNTSGELETDAAFKAASLEATGDLTVGGDATITGDLQGSTATFSGAVNVDSLEIGGTGYGITSAGAAKMDTVEAVNGLTVGAANAITGTAASLDMGANDLTNIKDLTTTGDATIGGDASVAGDFSVAGDTSLQDTTVTGDLVISDGTNDATLNVQYVTATGYDGTAMADNLLVSDTGLFVDDMVSSTHGFGVFDGTTMKEVFDIDDTGSISSDMLKTDSAANTVTLGDSNAGTPSVVDVEGQLILNSDGGATEYVDAIDDGTTAATSAGTNNDHTMATLASVLTSAENGDYTNNVAAADTNITTGTTIHDAINDLDVKIGSDADYTSAGVNGVAAANSIKGNIDAVNVALGDVSTQHVYGSTATDLTTAVNDLNDNMAAVLGAMYDATTGGYDNTQLAANGFTTQADLTASLADYAVNVETALGGNGFTGAVWDGVADNSLGSNSYAYTNTADVMSQIDQVASNIGTAAELAPAATPVAGGLANNGVAATNTVNANIGNLNAALGDVANFATSTTDNLRTGGTGGTDPETAVEALQNIDATLGQIHGLQSTSALGAKSNLKADAATVSVADHLDSLDSAIGDRTLRSSNAAIDGAMSGTSVAAGLQAAGNAIGDMNFATTKYVTAGSDLSDAVRTLDGNLYRVENDLKDLRKEFKNGMASMSAMSALVPNPRATGNTSLSVGTGLYSGHTAVAVGGFHYLTDNVMLNAGAAWGNANDLSYRMGITWSW